MEILERILILCTDEEIRRLGRTSRRMWMRTKTRRLEAPTSINMRDGHVKAWEGRVSRAQSFLRNDLRVLDFRYCVDCNTHAEYTVQRPWKRRDQALLRSFLGSGYTSGGEGEMDIDEEDEDEDMIKEDLSPETLQGASSDEGSWNLGEAGRRNGYVYRRGDKHVDQRRTVHAFLLRLLGMCPGLSILELWIPGVLMNEDLQYALAQLKHLHTLSLVQCFPFSPSRVSLQFPPNLTTLHCLDLTMMPLGVLGKALSTLGRLTQLKLTQCAPGALGVVLTALIEAQARNLSALEIREAREMGGRGMESQGMDEAEAELTVALRRMKGAFPVFERLEFTTRKGWNPSVHLPLLHAAVGSTLGTLQLDCAVDYDFGTPGVWPTLRSLALHTVRVLEIGDGIDASTFPALELLVLAGVQSVRGGGDPFPGLRCVNLFNGDVAESLASLLHRPVEWFALREQTTEGIRSRLDLFRHIPITHLVLEYAGVYSPLPQEFLHSLLKEYPNIRHVTYN